MQQSKSKRQKQKQFLELRCAPLRARTGHQGDPQPFNIERVEATAVLGGMLRFSACFTRLLLAEYATQDDLERDIRAILSVGAMGMWEGAVAQ